MSRSGTDPARTGFAAVLAEPEFRAMYLAQLFSIVGDQVAKVALAIMVYDRTSSAALSALVYCLTLLPWLAAPALSSLGDRYPRRDVLAGCDAARAALVCLMLIPGTPLGVLLALLAAVSLLAPAFEAARAALVADILTGERYVHGSALAQMSNQAGQVAGFAAGGALVGALSTRGALALDAVTFVASALTVRLAVRRRPAPTQPTGAQPAASGRRWTAGIRYVFGDPQLRSLLLLTWSVAFAAIPPEGLAVAVVRSGSNGGGGDAAAGLLTAAGPLGLFVGAFAVGRRLSLERQLTWMRPLAMLAVVPLCLSTAVPGGTAGLFCLWAASGAGGAFNLPANTAFVRGVAGGMRSRAFGVAQGGIQLAQAAGLLLAGLAAEEYSPRTVVAAAGVVGVLAVAAVWSASLGTKLVERSKRVKNPTIP
jgi:MFS family permease